MVGTKVVVARDCSIGASFFVATGALLPLVHDLLECGIVEIVVHIACLSQLP